MPTLNINVGILGHVDSGKTSLAKALSSVSSTACFDKNPQSRERGITLDLGFSSMIVPDTPQRFVDAGYDRVQVTFVDCPGHASLIRTIIGGAQIIEIMLLVIDVTKGIQTQTAECIVIGEMLNKKLLVVLNKVDLLPAEEQERARAMHTVTKRLRTVLTGTRWPNASIVPVSANSKIGLDTLIQTFLSMIPTAFYTKGPTLAKHLEPSRFVMLVDHCFAIKGQGTVLTGTILRGSLRINEQVEIPHLKERRKVKSIQVFRQPTDVAYCGDRVGVCVSNLNPELIERTIVCAPGTTELVDIVCVLARVHKVRYYKGVIANGAQMHVSVGHETVMATARFFKAAAGKCSHGFESDAEFEYLDELPDASAVTFLPSQTPEVGQEASPSSSEPCGIAPSPFAYFAVLQFDRTVILPLGSTLIGAKLDAVSNGSQCRLMLQGKMEHSFTGAEEYRSLNVVRYKRKVLSIDRVVNDFTCIAKGLVKGGGNDDVQRYMGYVVHFQAEAYSPYACSEGGKDDAALVAAKGKVDSAFGKTGKVKLVFTQPIFKRSDTGGVAHPGYTLVMHLKKRVFAKVKTVLQ